MLILVKIVEYFLIIAYEILMWYNGGIING